MEREEFYDYIQDNIRDYLPESYQRAEIMLLESVKLNDMYITSLLIRRPGESIVCSVPAGETNGGMPYRIGGSPDAGRRREGAGSAVFKYQPI